MGAHRTWLIVGWLAFAFLAGCGSTRDWNPYVDVKAYDTVVVEAFADGELAIGRSLADQLASELTRRGAFETVRREYDGGPALVIGGRVLDYDEGNVPARIKFGRGVGESRLAVELTVRAEPGGERVGSLIERESTLQTGPDARRTGREGMDWLRRELVEDLADALLEAIGEG